jgi:serine/threonine-protein kinase
MSLVTNPDHDPLIDQVVGSYRIEKLIGKGGMGAVYLATHQTLGRRVAFKVLLPEYTARADISARFVQEAVSASHVRGTNGRTHRNVAEPIDTGILPDGRHFLMVEFLEGCDLETYITQRGRLAEDEVFSFVAQTCAALYAAHTATDPKTHRPTPIVHRDLKPANLFLTRDDRGAPLVKLLDFGIAKVASAMRGTGIQTGAGLVMGSPAYMSPEQARAPLTVDARADLYALGVVIYQLLTARLPHVADNPMGFILAKQEQTPPPIATLAPDVAPVWDRVVARLLAWEPADRYADARAVVRDLVDGTQGLPGVVGATDILAATWPTFAADADTGPASAPSAYATPAPRPPSTLSAAAGARSASSSPPRRRGLFVALGATAAAGIAIGVALSSSGSSSSSTTSTPATVPNTPAVTTTSPPTDATTAPIDAAPSVDAPTPTTPTTPTATAPADAAPSSTSTPATAPPASSTTIKPPRRKPSRNRGGMERP